MPRRHHLDVLFFLRPILCQCHQLLALPPGCIRNRCSFWCRAPHLLKGNRWSLCPVTPMNPWVHFLFFIRARGDIDCPWRCGHRRLILAPFGSMTIRGCRGGRRGRAKSCPLAVPGQSPFPFPSPFLFLFLSPSPSHQAVHLELGLAALQQQETTPSGATFGVASMSPMLHMFWPQHLTPRPPLATCTTQIRHQRAHNDKPVAKVHRTAVRGQLGQLQVPQVLVEDLANIHHRCRRDSRHNWTGRRHHESRIHRVF